MPRRGENIYKRKDGRWEGRYAKERVNGKTKYGYVYARTYKEVKEKLSMVSGLFGKENQKPAATNEKRYDISFGVVAAAWFEASQPRLKESSIVKYANVLTVHLLPCFQNREIASITREEVVELSNALLLSGDHKGGGLASKTVMDIISVLKSVFEYAAQYEKLPVAKVDKIMIKQVQKPMRVLSLTEQKKLSRYLCENLTLTNLGILVCLYTGIRIGEVCALKWEDISFDEQYLYVHKTMQRIQTKGEEERKTMILISDPKSECSIRKIPLPNEIFQFIIAAKCPEDTYFLTGLPHTYVEPRTLQNRFKAIMRICNIKSANFHALRHTFATRCIELGFDIKSLSEILGHANVNITLNRYVHPSMELKQKNMNLFSELFDVK